MTEEVQMYLDDAKERMIASISFLENELSKIRAGKANPRMLEGIKIDYYGTITPVHQVSSISSPDAKTIVIQPWERNIIGAIEKAILVANIGVTPINNGEIIRLVVPPLTEERRRDIVKQVKNEGENAKVSVRNIRRDVNDELKKLKKDGVSEDVIKNAEDIVQKFTDDYVKKIESIVHAKEEDVMKV
ncbi:MAG: ribosome recycling factor [Bacteroidetes bacterium GWF2_33_38]|nr:MAG: ribosome recycling factor [Bacteroidetes bacterium GWF2_33_38]OFY74216.1 MAG: ribosome recycling factor [Bacteroidetes bacterium RIFOXYA12_FULL_33_9]HBX50631.1 ribosome recycling factor [Bacteroidales bacterium]